ncbi:hypothetical protein VTN00DRAFT_9642 [Thermoascus crustaceus]|uniref:uncharacterized protein n=1 Tax=Thermoascus crustaceus TaxID=5088 RepID=UPI003743AE81
MFAATYLQSTAAQWFDPYLKDRLERSPEQQRAETTETFNSFNAFLTHIKQNFRDLDESSNKQQPSLETGQNERSWNTTIED